MHNVGLHLIVSTFTLRIVCNHFQISSNPCVDASDMCLAFWAVRLSWDEPLRLVVDISESIRPINQKVGMFPLPYKFKIIHFNLNINDDNHHNPCFICLD